MVLLIAITLRSLKFNTRYFARHVVGHWNIQADNLSRMRITKFLEYAPDNINNEPDQLPPEL